MEDGSTGRNLYNYPIHRWNGTASLHFLGMVDNPLICMAIYVDEKSARNSKILRFRNQGAEVPVLIVKFYQNQRYCNAVLV